MASWQSKAVSKVLSRAIRDRLTEASSAQEMRKAVAAIDKMVDLFTFPSKLTRTLVSVDGVPCEWFDLSEKPSPAVVLFFHGGGFTFKSPITHGAFLARLCKQLGARGLMVDYRLAPESPYPAALEDCFTAYHWLIDQGTDPANILVIGDSAGGNLVLTSLLKALDEGLPMPGCAAMLSPTTDFLLCGDSVLEKHRQDPFLSLSAALSFRQFYIGPEHIDQSTHRYLSPLYADLSGLPPLMIHVGTNELLRDDSTRLAERAREFGVEVDCKLWDGLFHVFPLFNQIPEAQQATDDIVEFCNAHLGCLRKETAMPEAEPALSSSG